MTAPAVLSGESQSLDTSQLLMLHEFALILNSTHNFDEIIKKSASKIREITRSDGCHILFSRQVRDTLKLETVIHDGGKPLPGDVDETKGISGLTFETGKMVLVTDAENDPRVTKRLREHFGHKSMVSVPIVVKERTVGVILVYSTVPAKYNEQHGQFLMMLGSHLGLAVENARLVLELSKAAVVDPLTGAYNYRYFRHELENIIKGEDNKCISLVMLDINNFKQINDSYGHLAGDYVLRELAGMLQQNVRSCDTVTRNGGDEFALILPGATAKESIQVMKRIEEAVKEHVFRFDGNDISVTVSWGAITSKCLELDGLNRVIAQADKRLYNMKKARKKKNAGKCKNQA